MGAICKYCNCDMTEVDSCTKTTVNIDGIEYVRSRFHFNEQSGRCHDCGIIHGELHHCNCDVEQCPVCKDQLLSCGCIE